MLKSKLQAFVLLGALYMVSGASTAAAAGNYSIPIANAVTVIGEFGGYAWAGTSTDFGGTCTWFMIGTPGQGDYGLTDNWNINGTNSSDWVEILMSSGSWCGVTLNLIAPYHTINIFGQGGDDILRGGWASSAVNGMSGNDNLHCRRSNCVIDGGSSNDTITMTTHSSARIFASTGDDGACITNAAGTASGTVFILDGGGQTTSDRRCGSGTNTTTGWESNNCAPCGF
jgi:hypothetical protein